MRSNPTFAPHPHSGAGKAVTAKLAVMADEVIE